MKENPIVSIIIPVFNRDKCISVCLESILKSEFPYFEIIVVDDGSIDNTSYIIKEIAARDTRVKYFHKDNEGVSTARNYGISKSNGEWLTFVDSDDAILPSHLNILNSNVIHDADLLMTDKTEGKVENGEIILNDTRQNKGTNIIVKPTCADYLFGIYNPFVNPFYHIWNKFFKSKIIKTYELSFDKTLSLGEDQVFVCDYLMYAKKICHFKQKTYVNINWKGIHHLGSCLRTPQNYLYNQKRNYEALTRLIPKYGDIVKEYAIDYGIDRPISRIIINYTKIKNRNLLEKDYLLHFIKSEIKPFISSIDISLYNAKSVNVRFIRFLIINNWIRFAIFYSSLFNIIDYLLFLLKRIIKKM